MLNAFTDLLCSEHNYADIIDQSLLLILQYVSLISKMDTDDDSRCLQNGPVITLSIIPSALAPATKWDTWKSDIKVLAKSDKCTRMVVM